MTETQASVAVLGGGSFGTAIANIIAANGHPTTLWMRDHERAARCNATKENREYLPDYPLSENLTASADLESSVAGCDLVFISVPSSSFREVAAKVSPLLGESTMVVSTTKGIENPQFKLMSQILAEEIPQCQNGVLSGPNFAKEIVQQHLTGSVIASEHSKVTECVQARLCSETFRLYANHDPFGVELAGALKNIYAIIAGMADAIGAGQNTMAMLLTRSLAEMGRFAQTMGADPMTLLGLAGIGDLVLTCGSNLSRNYRVGYGVGQGRSLDEVVAELGQVAEGVNTVRIVKKKADEMGVYMPLACGLHAVLFEGKKIDVIVRDLMVGEQNTDVEFSDTSPTV